MGYIFLSQTATTPSAPSVARDISIILYSNSKLNSNFGLLSASWKWPGNGSNVALTLLFWKYKGVLCPNFNGDLLVQHDTCLDDTAFCVTNRPMDKAFLKIG